MRRWLGIALLAAWMALPMSAGAQEQRCTDLGGDCLCSEPLQATNTISSTTVNPNDTSTKECAGGTAVQDMSPFANHSFVLADSPPTALPGMRALQVVGATSLRVYPNTITSTTITNGSICRRHLRHWLTGAAGPLTSADRGKLCEWSRVDDGSTQQGQPERSHDGVTDDFTVNWSSPVCGGGVSTSGDTLAFSDCVGAEWCEVQWCNFGDLADGDTMGWRFRITSLDASGAAVKQRVWTRSSCNFGYGYRGLGTSGNGQDIIVNGYTQGTVGQNSTQQVAFAMQAKHETDPDWWIPLPTEISGIGSPGQPAFMPWRVAP